MPIARSHNFLQWAWRRSFAPQYVLYAWRHRLLLQQLQEEDLAWPSGKKSCWFTDNPTITTRTHNINIAKINLESTYTACIKRTINCGVVVERREMYIHYTLYLEVHHVKRHRKRWWGISSILSTMLCWVEIFSWCIRSSEQKLYILSWSNARSTWALSSLTWLSWKII